MGKSARQKNRELAAQAAIATDLNMVQTRPFLVAGVQTEAVNMMTPMGPTPGVRLTFHMQNGDIHNPIILDPIFALQVIAGMGLAITNPTALDLIGQGPPAPEPPGGPDVTPTDETVLSGESTTPSGLIIPT